MIKITITPTPESDHRVDFAEYQKDYDRTRWQGSGLTDRLPREKQPSHPKAHVVGPDSFVPGSNESGE
jgi:hypothetical protein